MKRVSQIILFILVGSFTLYAQQVTRTEAISAAVNVMRYRGICSQSSDIDTVYRLEKDSNTLVYEVFFRSGESVVLSGNKKCKPVIGYSIPSNSESIVSVIDDRELTPCCFKDFFNNYVNQIYNSFKSENDEAICLDWYDIQSDCNEVPRNTIAVGPLLSTRWGQSVSNDGVDPNAYNYYVTESGTNCNKCFAGCGPVALAQLMKYWNYPVCSPVLEKQFDWCNMSNYLLVSFNNNYEVQRNSISYLMRKCGKALSAVYCNEDCSTTTYLSDVPDVLRSFSYECSNYMYKPDNQDEITAWKNAMKSDLDNGMPIYYYGKTGNEEGHFFICDGYDTDMFFHFNWGWNGNYNNYWFDIDNLIAGYNFNYRQGAIFNIKPSPEQDMCDYVCSLANFYALYNALHPLMTFDEYNITPRTMTTLVSATSSSPASYRTIPTGATAEYVAHKEVILQPGFTAEYGSNFTARIEPCEACEERMIQVDVLTENDDWQGIDTSQMEMRMYKKGDTAILFQPSVLTLFPNPTSNTLTVQAPNPTEDIQIFDIAGHRVYRWYIESRTEKSTVLNIADIPTGNYILRVQTKDGKSHIGRFAKK